ncbi:MAG: hypothetical protein COT46_11825 [Sulfurimonas sp. CG08_land_8_20_14_0_20_36_33]|nr:MAG: hypothetical protein COX50_01000 [Sulfurimonas sp. CG23_combo_of_CG06-09_8_20_14_all_36_33]PIS23800.1 MAG: hypothetical protein COT46_11825 [Sulfurimonas sp. CG08_land_8_20_14_0_20_36_33]PIU34776.1 MAG: hypothetical protein COT05_06385 [Sulfurimonas sp. CG07_land_8_20_14_0_80_36_56]PIV05823.1 MAG: hypothetical protein COS56_00190 [Sulfurimonas sp. CG03_land_8_20_14_0_80_36_25]PIV35924.1 MAG: hypothetical protein COS32_04725 [Sulfurimonas sp. CG02_land_8_20_14_3_00_36_67]PIV61566.1 MAG:
MKIMRYIIILLLITTLYGDGDKHYREYHINKELSHLNLSKEQNIQIKTILKEFRHNSKEFKNLKEDVEEKRKRLFTQENFDTDELNELNTILDEKAHAIENVFLKEIHMILTPQQRKRFIHYFDDWEVE